MSVVASCRISIIAEKSEVYILTIIAVYNVCGHTPFLFLRWSLIVKSKYVSSKVLSKKLIAELICFCFLKFHVTWSYLQTLREWHHYARESWSIISFCCPALHHQLWPTDKKLTSKRGGGWSTVIILIKKFALGVCVLHCKIMNTTWNRWSCLKCTWKWHRVCYELSEIGTKLWKTAESFPEEAGL